MAEAEERGVFGVPTFVLDESGELFRGTDRVWLLRERLVDKRQTDEDALHPRRSTMAWSIERRAEHVALVTMNTNKANAQNPTFFEDVHRAFDRLEAEFNDLRGGVDGHGARVRQA